MTLNHDVNEAAAAAVAAAVLQWYRRWWRLTWSWTDHLLTPVCLQCTLLVTSEQPLSRHLSQHLTQHINSLHDNYTPESSFYIWLQMTLLGCQCAQKNEQGMRKYASVIIGRFDADNWQRDTVLIIQYFDGTTYTISYRYEPSSKINLESFQMARNLLQFLCNGWPYCLSMYAWCSHSDDVVTK